MKRYGFSLLALLIPAAAGADIFEAASDGDLNKIDEKKDQVHEIDPRSGLTAWQIATVRGRVEAADLLMHHGADPKLEFPEPAKTLDKLLTHYEKENAPGVAVLVAKDGEIVLENGYGLANLESGEKITKDTVFRIGSITKQFAAVATLLLADDEKLSVDDKLSKFYPDWPRGDEIALHHLMTHTSGMTSFTSLPNFEPYEPTTPDEVIATFRDKDHMFDPGKDWHYCNSGYFLLGEIAEQVGGKPYPQLLKERIFDSNKMTKIGAHRPELKLDNEALGYIRVEEGWGLPEKDWHMSHAGGAGEFYATLGELFHW
ncbi:MAG: serine hydrolase domain-containing protein, partial [Verrucomicrobiota bacterium]